ncbi:MAG TPA: threonine synthase [Nitrolancea sp.]|nr:threonine synthase [Nitrolancea sp.]
MYSYITNLECTYCGETFDKGKLMTTCPKCGKVLFARYDLKAAAKQMTKEALKDRPWNLWRYHEILPVENPDDALTLGEAGTALLPTPRLGQALGLGNLLVKDDGQNPTGSFKARGLCAAVSMARELGAKSVAIPSAGNAASAMSAYAARGGLDAFVFMPADAPEVMKAECVSYGAKVFLVKGLINDAGKIVREGSADQGWFDVSTLKEPYRAEGKKTMGLELAEQLGWRVPDAIVYPTGGGTGIVGMWKAFDELEQMGLIGSKRPKMIVVQSTGCAPIVKAFQEGKRHAELWQGAETLAPGIRVPVAIGDYLILDAVRQSGGTAIAVPDSEIMQGVRLLAAEEGVFASPEVGAVVMAAKHLREDGFLKPDDEVLLYATGSGMKHTDLVHGEYPLLDPNAADVVAQVVRLAS